MAFRSVEIGDIPVAAPSDPGSPPMLQWLKLSDLSVDEAYQREIGERGWRSIKSIASKFQWSKFGTILVAPVAGGIYAIVDGQHRAHAAAICGFEAVPCQVVQINRGEQASAFAAVNSDRVQVTLWQAFRAALAAGEEWAVKANGACEDAGCKLMMGNTSANAKRAGEIYAIGRIRAAVDGLGPEAVTAALAPLRRSMTGRDPLMWADAFLRPWLTAVLTRPWLAQRGADLAAFIDGCNIGRMEDDLDLWIREKRKAGVKTASRHELLAAEIGSALDAAFSPRLRATPAPTKEEADD